MTFSFARRVSRRGFFARVLGLAGALPALPAAAASVPRLGQRRQVPLLDCPIAGLQYYRHAAVAALIAPGQTVRLRREPANPYDRRAIEVLTAAGVKLGYLPRACNEAAANLLDAGEILTAEITAHHPDRANPWERLQLAVRLLL